MAEALAAGGTSATLATLTLVKTNTCPNASDTDALYQALVDTVALNLTTSQALTVVESFVASADTIGTGACVTFIVYDQASDSIVYTQQVHTSVPAAGSPAASSPPTYLRHALRGRAASRRGSSSSGSGGSASTRRSSSTRVVGHLLHVGLA